LQCVAVGCSVLQCVAVCCSVLQCVAVCCSVYRTLQHSATPYNTLQHSKRTQLLRHLLQALVVAGEATVPLELQRVRELQRRRRANKFLKNLQCVAVCCSERWYVAVCCSVLQCVAVCCSVLQ